MNRLWHNVTWGQRGNFLSVPTDCPQRDERLGWLADAQVFLPSAALNMDVAAFITKWGEDILDAQSPDGAYPDVAPRLGAERDGAPAWGDAGVIVPWTIYERYGDARILERHWDAMERYMAFLRPPQPGSVVAQAPQQRLRRLAVRRRRHAARGARDRVPGLRREAHGAHRASVGKGGSGGALRRAAPGRRRGVQPCVRGRGRLHRRRHADRLPAGPAHGSRAGRTTRARRTTRLVADIERHDWHLTTGFIGVGLLCPVLSAAGYADVAYRLLLNETFPSWGYSIRQGATTIWERWDGWTEHSGFQTALMNSFNHYSLGSVAQWLYEYVGGIRLDPERPGYGHVVIAPELGPLQQADVAFRSVRGQIRSRGSGATAGSRSASKCRRTSRPRWCFQARASSRRAAWRSATAPGVRGLHRQNGAWVAEIGSGTYEFFLATSEREPVLGRSPAG